LIARNEKFVVGFSLADRESKVHGRIFFLNFRNHNMWYVMDRMELLGLVRKLTNIFTTAEKEEEFASFSTGVLNIKTFSVKKALIKIRCEICIIVWYQLQLN
jgi:hypothetical protein